VLGLECQLGTIIKGNQVDSLADKSVKNLSRTGDSNLSDANVFSV
jgi:hypothetical protein